MSKRDIKSEFIKSSFEYLVKCGLENTSVRDLCRETKISSGSMYYWFSGKDDIYISAAKYGVGYVVEEIFKYIFKTMNDIDLFFDNFIEEVDKYKAELRLVFQITTSPVFGTRMRERAEEFKPVYEDYIGRLAGFLGCGSEKMAPIIYMLISVVVDYVTWEDTPVTKMQLEFLKQNLKDMLNTK